MGRENLLIPYLCGRHPHDAVLRHPPDAVSRLIIKANYNTVNKNQE